MTPIAGSVLTPTTSFLPGIGREKKPRALAAGGASLDLMCEALSTGFALVCLSCHAASWAIRCKWFKTHSSTTLRSETDVF